ncbi:hypothetical protein SELMODRAFT_403524 [Selaginella moellendorffii]|uniref:Kinesin motor domain-containing protein n=1 Tax=Selaginella moellendorffii TaxID=88036 RepID=D8QRP5_SELML|nr:hypothetical protein SELMODRAFT_403524 [Selaginella moellendorffii]
MELCLTVIDLRKVNSRLESELEQLNVNTRFREGLLDSKRKPDQVFDSLKLQGVIDNNRIGTVSTLFDLRPRVIVINKLSEGPGKSLAFIFWSYTIPGQLTRILQSVLNGNAETAIIYTITPHEMHTDETKGTLQFSSRVVICVHVNETLVLSSAARDDHSKGFDPGFWTHCFMCIYLLAFLNAFGAL